MLDYSFLTNNCFLDLDERWATTKNYVLNSLKDRREKYKSKMDIILNLQYEASLIEQDIINILRDDASDCGCNIFNGLQTSELLWEAWRFFNLKPGEEVEETNRKQWESAFSFVIDRINSLLLENKQDIINNIELKSLYSCGYDGHTYQFEYYYKTKDLTFSISVPNFRAVNKKNYLEMICGYRFSYEEHTHIWNTAAADLDPKKASADFFRWLEEYQSPEGSNE